MKLHTKHREGSKVTRTYHEARTPLQRLVAAKALPPDVEERLTALFHALDPVRLLQQLHTLQEALWQHAIVPTASTPEALETPPARINEIHFNVHGCGLPARDRRATGDTTTASLADLAALLEGPSAHKRKYRRAKAQVVRTWRTRADPFASIWDEVCLRLEAAPERTAKTIFLELQQQYPGQYTAGQLRTLQRRVKDWRAHAILQFDQHWLDEELLPAQILPADLHAHTAELSPPMASAG
jgi:hypothetical protein